MFGVIFDEVRKMARHPGRALQMFHVRRWRQFFGVLLFEARTGNRWQTVEDDKQFKRREYSTYEQYVRHQQSKFQYLDLADYDANYRRLLTERLRNLPQLKSAASVLCLGARQGTEVKAFHDLGCFAVGLDLNPGKESKLVLHGDFHDIQFPRGSVDVVFTNSLDHAFDIKKLMGEVNRVLKPEGLLIVEAIHGEEQETAPDHYASFWWKKVDDLVTLLAQHGFKPAQRTSFSQPWPGEQICFVKAAKNGV
jgi:SAM-dependent methyltransferase